MTCSRFTGFAVLAIVLSGCGAGHEGATASVVDAGVVPEQCDRYLARYTYCFESLGQPADAVEGRAAAARESFAHAPDPAAENARCLADLKRINAACP